MIRLYCPEKNVFVDPTDRNVLVWFQQHPKDPTIGTLQTFLLYNETRIIPGGKSWDEKARKIRYRQKHQKQVSGRYRLYQIQWSGLYDSDGRPIFHGDILREGQRALRVVHAHGHKVRILATSTGEWWGDDAEDATDYKIIDSAVLNPHLVGETLRDLFVYPKTEES